MNINAVTVVTFTAKFVKLMTKTNIKILFVQYVNKKTHLNDLFHPMHLHLINGKYSESKCYTFPPKNYILSRGGVAMATLAWVFLFRGKIFYEKIN